MTVYASDIIFEDMLHLKSWVLPTVWVPVINKTKSQAVQLQDLKIMSSSNKRSTGLSTKFFEDFKDFYPKLVDKTIANYKYMKYLLPKDLLLLKRISEYYNVSKPPIQGKLLVYAYELLESPGNISDEKAHQAYVLGCVIEAVQTCFMIENDVMDKCETRENKTAWHLLPDASPMGINDTQILQNLMKEMLKQNMDKSIYAQTMDILNEMFLTTGMGQRMDYTLSSSKDYGAYTMDNYNEIAQLKTSYYVMNTPLQCSLILSDKANEDTFRLVGDVCNDLGLLIQINNEFTEYLKYDSKDTTKFRSIASGKCSWPAVIALQKLGAEQANIFKECYGSSDQEKLKRVKQLYDEVNLKELYKHEENTRYDTFLRSVKKLPENSVPSSDFFLNILEFFKRDMMNTQKIY